MSFPFDESVLAILACPETHSPLAVAQYRDAPVLVCTDPAVHRCYPVIDDIPDLLIESAMILTPEQHAELLASIAAKK